MLGRMRILARDEGPVPVRILRWLSRAAAVVSLGLLAAFATSGGEAPTMVEWALFALFPVGVSIGTALSWRHEVLGGGIAVGSVAAFHAAYLLASGGNWPGPWFLVFTAPAAVLLACGLWTRAWVRGRGPSSREGLPGPRHR